MARVIILVALLAIAMTKPAYAYIDPGTASIALQAVIGAIAVAGFYFRSTIANVLRLLRPAGRKIDNEAQHRVAEPVEHHTDDS